MYYISQLYGIRLDALYEKNLMEKGTEPGISQTLQLRKGLKGARRPFEIKIRDKMEREETGKKDKQAESDEEDEIIFEFDP